MRNYKDTKKVRETTAPSPVHCNLLLLILDDSLSCSQPSSWYSVWRTRYIVQASPVTEVDGFGVTTVLTTDSQLDFWFY